LVTRRKNDAPSSTTIEASIFGPGVGECCLLHLGAGKWFVVDSCTDLDGHPVALTYLNQLGVDVADAVCGILVTHWHDDHIAGVAELLEAAPNATFHCPAAFGSEELLQLVVLQRGARVEESGGIDELDRVFSILKARKPKYHRKIGLGPNLVKANEQVFFHVVEDTPIGLKALSPSSEDIHRAHQAFAQMLPRFKDAKRRAVAFHPNDASIVLRLTVGKRALLLGGDREVTSNAHTGWSVILDSEVGPRQAAFGYKIPHHGSKNADRDEIWTQLLLRNPISFLAPYRPSGLPGKADIERIKERTDLLYLTASRKGPKPSPDSRTVDKMMRLTTKEHRQLKSEHGQIRLRFEVEKPSSLQLDVMGTARAG
jgi:hypothetical protein